MWSRAEFMKELTRLDRTNLTFRHGFRAAVLVVLPLLLAFALKQPQYVLAALGAMFITNTEGFNSSPLPFGPLLLACLTEPIAFALGTLAGLNPLLSVPLVGLGVSIGLMASVDPEYVQVGKFTGIIFAIGVGLPGGSVPAALSRFEFSLLGSLIAFAGAAVHRTLAKRAGDLRQQSHYPKIPRVSDLNFKSGWFRDAVGIGIASAFGLALGLAFHLPRDFWIIVTLVSAARTKLGPTLNATLEIVLGTIAGVLIAAGITLTVSSVPFLDFFLLIFATLMFATRGVNLGLSQVWFTPFIIILLNLLYPGEWWLALVRLLDVFIGGGIAIATVYLLWLRTPVHLRHRS